jgi:alpha,alpha-trehalase
MDRAKEMIEKAMKYQNDLGLFLKEIATDGQFLGNFSQAISHIGFINAVWSLSQCGD